MRWGFVHGRVSDSRTATTNQPSRRMEDHGGRSVGLRGVQAAWSASCTRTSSPTAVISTCSPRGPDGEHPRPQAPFLAGAEGEVGALFVGPGVGLEVEVLAQHDGSPVGAGFDRPGPAQATVALAKGEVMGGRRGRIIPRVPFHRLAQGEGAAVDGRHLAPGPGRSAAWSWVMAMRSP